ncbi:hypothetical protein [Leeuwenhoekiella sp.]|uniref:hypothetical protein n=1 Tax=Leeuwenhoekiella sp. TaxID=1977054 RepID=UPI000C3854BB|nr:hypothetical protein [Leeuwenhoekiella sp.]MAO42131.1 hypothetical protein [Leeuwenhoekiella sp.]|tara:strand:+ start:478 stop:720 length:243 start_codon:yes stop_codon:yes gene_type:complete
MNAHQLYNRYDLITAVLKTTRQSAYFSVSQRTCLHQHRAAVMHALDDINAGDGWESATPQYQLPAHLEQIVLRARMDFKI